MPSINITEKDNTVYGLSTVTSNNIVFIPGNAITGPSDAPVLLGSREEFIRTFGSSAPEGPTSERTVCSSWDYASNMLLAGFPVLFRRIVDKANNANLGISKGETGEVVKSYSSNYYEYIKDPTTSPTFKTEGTEENPDGTEVTPVYYVVAKYEGSYGNSLSYDIASYNYGSSMSYYLRVFNNSSSPIETTKLLTVKASEEDISKKILEKLLDVNSSYIQFKLLGNIDDAPEVDITALPSLNDPSNSEALKAGKDDTQEDILNKLASDTTIYSDLEDKYLYDLKFVTSGGIVDTDNTNLPIASAMIEIAQARQDCLAILDTAISENSNSVNTVFREGKFSTQYATTYAPWSYMRLPDKTQKWMPGSFIFLYALAKSVNKGNSIWNPPAGVNRATVSEIIEPRYEIGGTTLDAWQNINGNSERHIVNPIMKIRQYGYVIYGQKTLYSQVEGSLDNRSALQELGVVLTVNDIKKEIYNVSLALTFEQNNIRTWNEFKGRLDPFMLRLKSEGAISDYQIVMDENVISDEDINENRIRGIVRISLTRAAEDFDITVELEPSSVTFSDDGDEYII